MKLSIDTAEVFEPLLHPARYKGSWGGRGSGKSHFFAELMVDDSLRIPGLRSVCIREVQKTLKESAKRLIEDKIIALKVGDRFRVLDDRIETPGGGVITFQGMQDHNAETIKSLEGFGRAWVEEAQTMSERSLTLLRPTIRTPDSELWFSWNPRRKVDAVDVFLRTDPPANSITVHANWRDNPWFPEVLRAERDEDLRKRPDQCEHIWEGAYVKVFQGAYFGKQLLEARKEGRITRVAADPILRKRAVWDIGGAGSNADNNSIWIVQFSSREILVLDYIEGQGQTLGYYVNELHTRGHSNALCVLPHDGVNANSVTGKRFEEHLNDAGFETKVVANQGKGAAMMRIEAVRRLFPRIWINEATTEAGIDALGSYHAKIDPVRQNDLGPDHDWACFTGDTEVLTRAGKQRIMDLQSGEVLTPCGYKRFKRLGITGRNAPLVEVRFSDGHTVRCTPEHLFLTENGWKSAASLTSTTRIRSSLTRSRSISMAAYTAFGRAKSTTLAAARRCIAPSGRWLSALFPRVVTSTTGTATTPITGLKIWSVCPLVSTYALAGLSTRLTVRSTSRLAPATVLPSGIALRKDASGIAATPNAASLGRNGNAKIGPASIAAQPSTASFGKAAIASASAPVFAKSLRIESARPISERADVWCIQVDDGEWFTLANGAVVHNSHAADAFGLVCIDYEMPKAPRAEDRYSGRSARGRSVWV